MPGLCIWYSSSSLFIDDTMPFMYAQTDPVTMWRWTTVMWEGYEGWGRRGRRIQGTAEFLCRLSLVLLSWMGGTPLFVCSSLCERVVTINSKTIPKDIQHGVDTISVHIRISTRAVLATTAMIKVCKFNYNHPPFMWLCEAVSTQIYHEYVSIFSN